MTNRGVGLEEKGILGRRLGLQEVGSCSMYNARVRSAMCLLSKNRLISRRSTNGKGEILPKSSPGHAVKPAARQPVERGQTVSCGPIS